jgi:pilus assembly protein FimV
MEPDNPLYKMTASAPVAENSTGNEPQAAVDAVSEEVAKPDLDFSLDTPSPEPTPEAPEKPEDLASLDFNLGDLKAEPEAAGLPELDIGEPSPAAPDESPQAPNDLDFQLDFPEEAPGNTVQLATSDFGQTISELDSMQPEQPKNEPADQEAPSSSAGEVETEGASLPEISFDLPEITIPSSTPTVADQPEAAEEIVFEPVKDTNESDFNFDVNFTSPENTAEAAAADDLAKTPDKMPELDLSGISFDLGTPATEEASVAASESPEVDTKLDLVTAYVDMGDTEGARELLDEVLKEGGPQQRERAQKILTDLG